MEIQRENSEHLWALCPNHDDHNASLCINKIDKGKYRKGYSYCFSCGHTIQFSEKAVDSMSNKKSICRKKRPIDWENLVNKYKLDSALHIEHLAKKWKVTYEVLKNYGLGWDGNSITCPMNNENWNWIGISKRFLDGSKSCINGSQLGLFIPNLEGIYVSEYKAVVCEGLSDAAVATHLGYFGIGKPSAGFGEQLVRKYLENINYKGNIIIVQDDDDAGRRSRVKLELALEDWDTRVIVPNPDLKDFYLRNGRNSTIALLRM